MAVGAPARQTPSQAPPAVRRPLFLIGIAMSLLAFLLVVVLGSVIAGRATVGTVQVSVVVAARDIHLREVIGAADLAAARLPVAALPPGAVLHASDAVGKVAQVDVLKGQPITTNLVAARGAGAPGYLPIPQGWVAATIPASEQQAVGGYVSTGDVIDVQASLSETAFTPNVLNPRQLTRTVFPGVRVIEVGPAGTRSGQALAVVSSLTVLLTPCDAPYLAWLLTSATVRYTLLSSTDYGPAPTGPSPSCPPGTTPARVGPAEVDKKFGFTKG
jgi:Flp pilus assembly protein CpaB